MKLSKCIEMTKIRPALLVIVLGIILIVGAFQVTASARTSASNYYHGKTLTIVVPFGPGGGFDRWARLVGRYIKSPLGVKQVKVVNKPGGGGLIGANTVYNSKPNGLTIGDISAAGAVFSDFNHDPGVKYNIKKFIWIGRPDEDPLTLFSHGKGNYQTFSQVLNAKHPLKTFASGKGAMEYYAQEGLYHAFGIPFQMVAAFKGSHQMVATFLSGEGDLFAITSHHAPEMGAQAKPLLVFSTSRFSKLPNVPTVVEEAKNHHLSSSKQATLKALVNILELGRSFVAPPGVPASRVKALRSAFRTALHNPALLKAAAKGNLYAGYADPQVVTQKLEYAVKNRKELLGLLNAK